MLADQCKLELNYSIPGDTVYISVPSAMNYLEVLALEIRNDPDMPDAVAGAYDIMRKGIERMEQEYREEVVNVNS